MRISDWSSDVCSSDLGFLMKAGKPLMSFGVMGGPMQAQGHVQMVVRTQLHGQNPQTASDAPRWRVISGRQVAIEAALPERVVAALAERGPRLGRQTPAVAAFGFGEFGRASCRERGCS